MKSLTYTLAGIALGASAGFSNPAAHFTNFFVQQELPIDGSEGTREIVYVPEQGQRTSPIAVDHGGARFELWTIDGRTFTEHLLDHQYVTTDKPVAKIKIITEDDYDVFPRTRADRPFSVLIVTNGLHTDDPDATPSLRSVRLTRHVQSYGAEGIGNDIDRNQATLLQEVFLVNNQEHHFSPPIEIPGDDRSKIRGEERFTVYSVADELSPASQLSSMFVQVWPVAYGSMSGIADDQTLRFETPQLTFTYQDLYPGSTSFARIYPGPLRPDVDDVEGKIVIAGSGPGTNSRAYPLDDTRTSDTWDIHIKQDGQWTIEMISDTPFDTVLFDHVTFNINRGIEVQGSVTTSE